MGSSRVASLVVIVAAICYGAPSVIGAFLLQEVEPVFRVISFVVGGLSVLGGILLWRKHQASPWLLWLSAFIYAAVMLLPALYRHGLSAFSVLLGAFYLSLAVRLLIAGSAHVLLRRAHG